MGYTRNKTFPFHPHPYGARLEWKRTLPRAKNMPLACFLNALSSPAFPFGSGGTPEGTRYIKELPPSSRRQATVHWTVAFYCSSPFYLEYKNGVSPKGYTVFGTPEGTRTPNPRNRNPMLYPLSHWRIHLKCLSIIAEFGPFVKGGRRKNFPSLTSCASFFPMLQ